MSGAPRAGAEPCHPRRAPRPIHTMQNPRIDIPPSAPRRREPGTAGGPPSTPFSLEDEGAYRRWRDGKLAAWPADPEALWVAVRDPGNLRDAERRGIAERCAAFNLAFYASERGSDASRGDIRALGEALGLTGIDRNPEGGADGIAAIRVAEGGPAGEYIPYTNRSLNWHTDGYYNPVERPIRGVIMHCVRQGGSGGASRFLDHEIAYILLRDENPAYVEALMAPDAMTIPANADPRFPRPARSGPVFSVDPRSGRLHMRYTARRRSIVWKAGAAAEAAECLRALLDGASACTIDTRLAPGQGVVCNNVLHARSAFDDGGGEGRLLWRARYRQRVADGTGPC